MLPLSSTQESHHLDFSVLNTQKNQENKRCNIICKIFQNNVLRLALSIGTTIAGVTFTVVNPILAVAITVTGVTLIALTIFYKAPSKNSTYQSKTRDNTQSDTSKTSESSIIHIHSNREDNIQSDTSKTSKSLSAPSDIYIDSSITDNKSKSSSVEEAQSPATINKIQTNSQIEKQVRKHPDIVAYFNSPDKTKAQKKKLHDNLCDLFVDGFSEDPIQKIYTRHDQWFEILELTSFSLYLKAKYHSAASKSFDINSLKKNNNPSQNIFKALSDHISFNRSGKRNFNIIPMTMYLNNNHWTLGIIDYNNKTIEYYDSFGHEPDENLKNAMERVADREGLQYIQKTTSKLQHNGYDCGVWHSLFLEEKLKNPLFNPNNLDDTYIYEFRIHMLAQIALIRI